MKQLLFLLAVLFYSCSANETERGLRAVINKSLNIAMFDSVLHRGQSVEIKKLRERYDFFSVVYLQGGCAPCYPRFVEWHRQMDSLNVNGNHAVLFVIDGFSYKAFKRRVLEIGFVDDRHYSVMDPGSRFLEANKDIPRWIIDASVLIDSENKIKMVGAPWVNEDMKSLFYKILQ